MPTPDTTPDYSPIDETTPFDSARSRWAPAPTARPFVPQARISTCKPRVQDLPQEHASLESRSLFPFETPSADADDMKEELHANVQEDGEEEESTPVRRSLVIQGVPPAATLQSIAKVLRGGMIFEMYLRPQRASAYASFVDPASAERFFEYAKANEVHVLGKKVCM